jgi:hypothetical protein
MIEIGVGWLGRTDSSPIRMCSMPISTSRNSLLPSSLKMTRFPNRSNSRHPSRSSSFRIDWLTALVVKDSAIAA